MKAFTQTTCHCHWFRGTSSNPSSDFLLMCYERYDLVAALVALNYFWGLCPKI